MSRMIPIVVSHYTSNTGYETEVDRLKQSLFRWKLDHRIQSIQSLGSWRANSNYCAKLVLESLHDFPTRDILRVDADAVFQRYPTIFTEDSFDADVAAVVHTWPRHGRVEFLGGTMYFRNCKQVRTLVEIWVQWACEFRAKERNGDLLQELLKINNHIKFVPLPLTYCKIFDLMKEVKNPVIEHFQASRRFKRQINREGIK
jgi:hypothetical protein